MSAILLKALLNASCKVDDNMCTFFLGESLHLLSAGCPTLLTIAMSFTALDKLENLTPFFKNMLKLNILLYLYWNKLERLSFVICLHTKDLLLHHSRDYLSIFGKISQKN